MSWPEAIFGSVLVVGFFAWLGWMLYLGFKD